jgi:riboflavin kinase/FMN adenylyltransferase
VLYPFTKEFSRLTSVEYVRDILVNTLKVQTLVIGYDHQFGRNREGGFGQLVEFSETYGFSVEEIPAHDIESVNVSSTKVRQALKEGDIPTVTQYLGHPFTVTGTVVEGKKVGHTIGYPTANIKVENRNKIIPAQGVYAVKVRVLGGEYKGMLNIGVNPTVVENGEQTIEVNIFEFDQDIYGAQATLEFVARLRNEEHFESLDALREQLNKDKINSIKILG